nr:late expression factor 8 [Ectropis obliqua nucleopolyhedrovirus]
MVVDGGMFLHMAGVIVSNVKINWIYDGKRYKIESCKKTKHTTWPKIYIYVRQLKKSNGKKSSIKTEYHKRYGVFETNYDYANK